MEKTPRVRKETRSCELIQIPTNFGQAVFHPSLALQVETDPWTEVHACRRIIQSYCRESLEIPNSFKPAFPFA